MVLLTMIARLADGLPLAASMQEDEQVHSLFCGGWLLELINGCVVMLHDNVQL